MHIANRENDLAVVIARCCFRILCGVTGDLEDTGRAVMGMTNIAIGRVMADGDNLQRGKYRCEQDDLFN